jgi:tRNA A37 threonylcarbamoyladenosine dehydratase
VSCEREPGQKGGIGCASGFGSATHITGTFGFMMAGAAINMILR